MRLEPLSSIIVPLIVVLSAAGCAGHGSPQTAAAERQQAVASEEERLQSLPLAELERLADAGDAKALLTLAVRHAAGQGVEKDERMAIAILERGIARGDAAAIFAMGVAYDNGMGVPKDDVAAVAWYQRAADLGYADAQYWFAMMISSGRGGIAATWTGAFPMFLKAAEQDHADAQFMVGWMYHNGIGIEPDAQKAADWYRRATSRFLNQKAQYNLRVLIEEGQVAWQEGDPGVPPLTVRKAEQ